MGEVRYFGILLVLSIVLGSCAAEAPGDSDPAADRAAAEDLVGAFFRAMEVGPDGLQHRVGWQRRLDAIYQSRGAEHRLKESRFHWIETAILTPRPGDSWKIDRLHSTVVSIEGAMAEGG